MCIIPGMQHQRKHEGNGSIHLEVLLSAPYSINDFTIAPLPSDDAVCRGLHPVSSLNEGAPSDDEGDS